jgi:hypothetical protein
MQDLEKALHGLPKINPSKGFVKASKNRLMYQINISANESWFKAFLKRFGLVVPSSSFIAQARMRLIAKISQAKKPAWAWFLFAKRVMASTLVMVIAVTATLFFVDGRQIVSASEETYIEVLSGTATVKHADRLIWDDITSTTELIAGDLIKIAPGSEAVVKFFDDTQIRLTENSLLLISQLAVSPAYARQGIIEVSLHEGSAWVQTLNAEDGYSQFTLVTRDAIVKTLNSTFNVQTGNQIPTTIGIYQNKVEIQTLQPDTRKPVDVFKVNSGDRVTVFGQFNSNLRPKFDISTLSDQERSSSWVQDNLTKDHNHLAQLRESEYNRLRESTGVLPGNMLYPLKQAKERLALAFSFNKSAVSATKVEIANKRLNEAIVLLQQGERQQAWQALMAYQSISRQIIEEAASADINNETIERQLVTPYQKALVASLSNEPITMVKEALNQTEELLAENPIDREQIRLQNSVDRLKDIAALIETGDFEGAKEALVNNQLVIESVLNEAENIEVDEAQKEVFSSILELRNEELTLLEVINTSSQALNDADPQLAAMLTSAEQQAKDKVDETLAFIRPLMPELIKEQGTAVVDAQIQYFVDKIGIYETWQGQKNQIERLLAEEGMKANNIPFLMELRGHLDTRAKDYLNTKILELQAKSRYQKHKIMKQKIDRLIRERSMTETSD